MNPEIQKIITHETARSLALFYRVPFAEALSCLRNKDTKLEIKLNPNDFPTIADHAVKALHNFARMYIVTPGDVIYLLNKTLY